MLVSRIFSFSHSVFYSIKEKNSHFSYLQFVVWKCFQLAESKILSFGEELSLLFPENDSFIYNKLTLYLKMMIFDTLDEKSLLKTLWKKEKMLLSSIFSFFHNVFYPTKEKFNLLSHI